MKTPLNNRLVIGTAWKQFFGQPITLFDLMKELDASSLVTISKFIDEKIDFLKSKPIGYILSKKDKKGFDHLFKVCIRSEFDHLGWIRARGNVMAAAGWIYEGGPKVSAEKVLHELVDLSGEIEIELSRRHFIIVDPAKVEFLRGGRRLLGEKVLAAFPSAENDIENAAHCLAMDLNTAAVFHLIRVAEFGMRALARHLKIKVKRNTIDSAGWTEIIQDIKDVTAVRWGKRPKGKKARQTATAFLKFCEVATDELNVFKEVWRNNVMHAGLPYNEHDAHGVYIHVRDFMQRLATQVSEINN